MRGSPAAVTIREAQRADQAPLADLWRRFLAAQAALDPRLRPADDALSRWHNSFADTLAGVDQKLWVAETVPSRLVGFAAAERSFSAPIYAPTPHVFLGELFVAEELRRRGVGRRLFGVVRDWAEKTGAAEVHLRVLVANRAARAFWDAVGAQPFDESRVLRLDRSAPPAGAGPRTLGF